MIYGQTGYSLGFGLELVNDRCGTKARARNGKLAEGAGGQCNGLRCLDLCYGYYPGEAWFFPDDEHGAPQCRELCSELRSRRQITHPSTPRSELQLGLVDLAA